MTFNKKLLAATLVTAGGFAAMSSANAVTDSSNNVVVESSVTATCSLDMTGANITFTGIVAGTAFANIPKQTSNIGVRCSNGAPYTVTLASANLSSTTGEGKMLPLVNTVEDPNTHFLTYQLYQGTSTSTQVWGTSTGTTGNAVSSLGGGLSATTANPHALTIAITSDTDIENDTYRDTVTAAITY